MGIRLKVSRPLAIAVGSLLFGILVYLWGFQTLVALKYRHSAKENHILWETPKPLPQTDASQTKGVKLSSGVLEFEVPWSDLDTSRVVTEHNFAVFVFRSGIGISFFGPTQGLLSEPKFLSEPKLREGFRSVFGSEAAQSNFALLKAELEATPAQIKPWTRRHKAVQTCVLLNLKASTLRGGETGVFTIQQNGWRGFQFDDPAQKPKRVELDLYDLLDRQRMLGFSLAKGSEAVITQQDINRVLQTLRPIAASNSN